MTLTRQQAILRLGLIMLIFVALGVAYNVVTPLHKAPDEVAHFLYSRFIAQTGRLPLDEQEREQAGYLSFWPPGYHAAVAALVGWQAGDGPPYLKFTWESPRFDLAQELLDTKRLANTADELWPFQGDVLLWHLGRGVSLLFGLGIILVTFYTALTVWPGNFRLAVWSAALIAFVPAFVFMSSVMSYESLVGLVTGLYFWLLLRLVQGDTRLRNLVGLGLLLGLSVTVKYSAIILPLEVMVVFGLLAWLKRAGWRRWLGWVAVTGLAAVAASGWWFLFLVLYFNEIDQYGPLVGALKPIIAGGIDASQNYIAAVLTGAQIGSLETPEITPDPFWAWLLRMFESFWAQDIGGFVLWPWAYLAMAVGLLVSLLGLVRLWRLRPGQRLLLAILLFHTLLFFALPLLRFVVQGNVSWTAQGRHALFPVATSLPVLLVFGWQAWRPAPFRQLLALLFVAGFLVWNLAQLVRVGSYFPDPLPIRTTGQSSAIAQPLNLAVGDYLVLLGYDTQFLPDEDALKISLFWRSPTYPDQDYRLAVRLVQHGATKYCWQGYPVNGQYPTRLWEAWETIRDDLYLPLVDAPPGNYEAQIEILSAAGPLPVGPNRWLSLKVTVPEVTPPSPAIPLPLSIADRPVVEGVTLWRSEPYRQGTLPEYQPRMAVTLLWRGQPAAAERVAWLLVSETGQVYSMEPASEHVRYAVIGGDWPAGNYRLRAEVWQGDRVIASGESAAALTVKNERPRRFTPPAMANTVEANFGNLVALLGYDLPRRALDPGQSVPVVLYWRGLRTMDTSYTVFAKLLDGRQQSWGSLDRFPADGYQTIYWLENEVVFDGFELPVDPNSPPGLYWLNVGLYQEVDGAAVSLPLVTAGQPTGETSVTFGPVKIGGPPPGVVVNQAKPDNPVNILLGDSIRLLGYNTPVITAEQLSLNLFWQSVSPTPLNFTIFAHLRNQAGEVVAQKDGPAGNGLYPTSVWDTGEVILDRIEVPLPPALPPGQYSLAVGLYDFATGERLPVAGSADNSLVVTEITKD